MKKKLFHNILIVLLLVLATIACNDDPVNPAIDNPDDNKTADTVDFSSIPQSLIYEIKVTSGNNISQQLVFQSHCPEYNLGYMDMVENDQYPLNIFSGRSISWTNFSFSGQVTVEVKVINPSKVPVAGKVRLLPSRYNITPSVLGETIRFTLDEPGQYSLEIGENGYKNGLMIFADPEETDLPDTASVDYMFFNEATVASINAIPSNYSGIYFKRAIHNMGIYHVPAHIKNIYFEQGSWVHGAIIMDANPNVKIFGRGVLSGAKLNYRESHSIEAINNSSYIHVEGIVLADFKHFAVRLIGINNTVKWVKTIGGWVYNCDGIAAYGGSNVSNCFIWANDDAIKVYRGNTTWSDCVVWQLNNGGVIQMGWTGPNSNNVTIQRIDVLHAEWNKPGFNRGLLNYVGNRYKVPGKSGNHSNWLIEDVVTENPIPIIFNITPDNFSTNPIHGLTLKNWNVKMPMGTPFQNMIIGNDPNEPFDGFVFENFVFNETELDAANWLDLTKTLTDNLVTPEFKY